MGSKRSTSYRVTPGCTHGIAATYAKGCRCDDCRAAWTEYRREPNRERARRLAHERKLDEARKLLRKAGEL